MKGRGPENPPARRQHPHPGLVLPLRSAGGGGRGGQAHCSPACCSFVSAKQNEKKQTTKTPTNMMHLLRGEQRSKNSTVDVDGPSSLGGNVVRWRPHRPASQGKAAAMTRDPAPIWFSVWKLPRLALSSSPFLLSSVDSDPFSLPSNRSGVKIKHAPHMPWAPPGGNEVVPERCFYTWSPCRSLDRTESLQTGVTFCPRRSQHERAGGTE